MAVSMQTCMSLFAGPRRMVRPGLTRPGLSLSVAAVLSLASALACAADPADAEAGRALFLKGTTPACVICHTLADAGSTGTIGPNLDELKPDANRVAQAVRNGIGVMPAFEALSDEQVQALAKYVSGAVR